MCILRSMVAPSVSRKHRIGTSSNLLSDGEIMQDIYIRHVVGRCPIDGMEILDNGQDDDPQHWEHCVAHLPFDQRNVNDDE